MSDDCQALISADCTAPSSEQVAGDFDGACQLLLLYPVYAIVCLQARSAAFALAAQPPVGAQSATVAASELVPTFSANVTPADSTVCNLCRQHYLCTVQAMLLFSQLK